MRGRAAKVENPRKHTAIPTAFPSTHARKIRVVGCLRSPGDELLFDLGRQRLSVSHGVHGIRVDQVQHGALMLGQASDRLDDFNRWRFRHVGRVAQQPASC